MKYPEVFFETATGHDDRVHPAHARKAAARLQELGYPFYYYENTEGGHSTEANLLDRAQDYALDFTYPVTEAYALTTVGSACKPPPPGRGVAAVSQAARLFASAASRVTASSASGRSSLPPASAWAMISLRIRGSQKRRRWSARRSPLRRDRVAIRRTG